MPDNPPPDSEIVFAPAHDLVRWLVERELSAEELMTRFLDRIEAVNPQVNAIVTLVPEVAIEGARAADATLARGDAPGPLHGLPIACKDLALTRGIRTTFGSPISTATSCPTRTSSSSNGSRRPARSSSERPTRPSSGRAPRRSTRSSGLPGTPTRPIEPVGAAAAAPRSPSRAECFRLRTARTWADRSATPRRGPTWWAFAPRPGGFRCGPTPCSTTRLSVAGPIGRRVADVALLLSAMAGPDRRVPLSIDTPGSAFREPLDRDFRGTRIAWSPTLGGYPVDSAVLDACGSAVARFGDIGCTVEEADPDLTDVDEIFRTMRAFAFAMSHEAHIRDHRELLKDTVIWNTEQGLALGAMDVVHAEVKRAALFDRMVEFFDRFDYLVCPTTGVPPFSVDTDWVREINGVELETYFDWMAACYAITVTGCPSISVPAGFTPDGLPIGIQIVAPPKCDFAALQLAHAYEGVAGFADRRPPL